MPDDTADFLSLHAVKRQGGPPIYALTPSSLAITVYRQQIRALNLAYSIASKHSGDNPGTKHIAIIGGGFAGVAVASGLLKLGFHVHLFEQRPELCHLQAGCETRWIHPRIYDWPSPNSDLDDARLPLLNWSAGTAGDVARIVRAQFDEMADASGGHLHSYLRANARLVGGSVQWDNADVPRGGQTANWRGRGGKSQFDVVILAVGFGIEEGVANHETTSYWRNDRYSQSQPGVRSERRELILISGTGDGALIDLVRVCLQRFKHNRVINDLLSGCPALIQRLQEIRTQHLEEMERDDDASLAEAFHELHQTPAGTPVGGQLNDVRNRLDKALRKDTRAILNGEPASFNDLLHIRDKSFLHLCLVYGLYQAKAFTYIGGRCKRLDRHDVEIEGYGRLKVDDVIVRHGTKRNDILLRAGLTDSEVEKLLRKRASNSKLLFRLWEPGWWSRSIPDQAERWLERVPSAEQVMATMVLGPLAESLRAQPSMAGCPFRTTLHQSMHYATREGDLDCYQQLAPYFGDATGNRLHGEAGRVFLHRPGEKSGLVGFSLSTGRAAFAQLPQDSDPPTIQQWIDSWQILIPSENDADGNSRFRQMDPLVVTTVVTVPIIARLSEEDLGVRYVIYLDIEHAENGARPAYDDIMPIMWGCVNGIVKSISQLRRIAAFEHRLIVPRSQLHDNKLIHIPTQAEWIGADLGHYQQHAATFGNLFRFEFPGANIQILESADVIELQAMY